MCAPSTEHCSDRFSFGGFRRGSVALLVAPVAVAFILAFSSPAVATVEGNSYDVILFDGPFAFGTDVYVFDAGGFFDQLGVTGTGFWSEQPIGLGALGFQRLFIAFDGDPAGFWEFSFGLVSTTGQFIVGISIDSNSLMRNFVGVHTDIGIGV